MTAPTLALHAATSVHGLLAQDVRLWYAAPLIVSVSLVYAATRQEETGPILSHAARFGGWVLVFMVAVTAALQAFAWMQ
ncbi:MAG: hypothetical protein AAF589_07235 [Planctomycetota bacterium]